MTNRRQAEIRAQRNTEDHRRVKAILEFSRSERPFPLADEAIATRCYALWKDQKRLHRFCVGFTDIHAAKIREERDRLTGLGQMVAEARSELIREISDEVENAIMMAVNEDKRFDECLKRQAEIDRGDRSMTDKDREFAMSETATALRFNRALNLIQKEADRDYEFTFGIFALSYERVRGRNVTEDRLRRDISEYIALLRKRGASDIIEEDFRVEVMRQHALDEETFDFDPTARYFSTDTSEMVTPNTLVTRIPFRQWVVQFETQMGGPLRPSFDRWWQLLDAYRAYLAQIAPAQLIIFNAARMSIATRMFWALAGVPESFHGHTSEALPGRIELPNEADAPGNVFTSMRQRLAGLMTGLDRLLERADTLVRESHSQAMCASMLIGQCTRLLTVRIECNVYPSEYDVELIQIRSDNALELITYLENERDARIRREAEQRHEEEQEAERQPLLVDTTPMEIDAMEQEAENITDSRRLIGPSPPSPEEQESSGDETLWSGEDWDRWVEEWAEQDMDDQWWP
ncbi:hypothetical protein SBOR_8840 [Sclerotinia borealis F-4128]|uniref:Uncharacterized protein n=1 Tax=Sclerotinia borealis (strain F-4128) TaxID=1432307 RepID=W9C7A9_SCLBF|nr:hypothetical protein SBOR_8840 [Sclerotinia borealis F-4128]